MVSNGLNARLGLVVVAALVVAGCASRQAPDRAAVEYRGTGGTGQPATAGGIPAAPVVGADGVVLYDGYEAIRAGQGDSVASLAGRVGLSASELAAYNGLAPDQPLRPGDELVLPPRPGGYGGTSVAAAGGGFGTGLAAGGPSDAGASAIATAPLDSGTPGSGTAATGTTGWSPDIAAAAIDRSGTPEAPLAPPPSAST
ncbi:MAG: LysM peptidoglycan-binding domain-containing protein, partial [Thermohalobaculum sp.]|nr:LysM peptidoglycan-binding domain-containing protein [Thermohalobaculum sp.]